MYRETNNCRFPAAKKLYDIDTRSTYVVSRNKRFDIDQKTNEFAFALFLWCLYEQCCNFMQYRLY